MPRPGHRSKPIETAPPDGSWTTVLHGRTREPAAAHWSRVFQGWCDQECACCISSRNGVRTRRSKCRSSRTCGQQAPVRLDKTRGGLVRRAQLAYKSNAGRPAHTSLSSGPPRAYADVSRRSSVELRLECRRDDAGLDNGSGAVAGVFPAGSSHRCGPFRFGTIAANKTGRSDSDPIPRFALQLRRASAIV
jgi:hypothetical protein